MAERADIADADNILALGDDDDNSGQASHKINDYASSRFTYYTTDVKTCNTGAGTTEDPKCVTVWAAGGEDFNTMYGGVNLNETANNRPMVKSGTVGGCARCGGVQGVTFEYFYLNVVEEDAADNEVVRIVIEDTIDADGNGVRRTIWGINNEGRNLREATIVDPAGTPQFWCRSWILSQIEDARRFRMMEYRTPAAHNVTTSTIDEFLKPCHDGNFANDTATLNAGSGAIYVYEYNMEGERTGMRVKKGRTGTASYLSATDYMGGTNQLRSHLMTAEHVYPTATTSRTDGTRVTTSYGYTFWSGTDNIQTTVTTYPVIPTTQNGSGTANSVTDYYDTVGRRRWHKDALGYVTYYAHHPENGKLAYLVRDADSTSLPSSADSNSTKWVTSTGGSASSNKPTRGEGLPAAIEQVSFREYDSQGRVVLAAMEDGTDGTVLSRHYSVYETNRELHFPYWDTSTNKPFLPIRAVAFDDGGNTVDTYEVDPDCTTASGGVPAGISATQDDYVRWTRYIYGEVVGNLAAEHAYHNIPSSGYGTKDTNYAETLAGYDAIRRQDRIVQPGGTIHRRVFDARSRVASVWVGTDDTPSSGEWSPTNNSGANMTKISEYEYDGGAVGGNSNLTKEIEYLTDDVEANAQVTKHRYDWRDRLVFSVDPEEYDGKATYSRQELDNLDRVTKDEKYYDADDDADFPDDGSADAGDRLLGRNEILWDNLSRVYLAKTYAVNPSNGAIGSALHSDVWYDASGHVIKGAKGNQLTKSVYDGLGRTTVRYISHDTDESAYADADDVSGDTVIEQSETAYDGSGNVIAMTHYARKHTAGSTGMLSSSDARVSYLAFWYDAASRRTAVANYGTNGGSAFSRPSTAPSSSDTVLVTTSEYDSAGRAYKTTDPAGREDRLEFDDMGRLTKTIQNYTDGNPATGGSDEDVTIERGYNADGALLTLTANNPTTGDQVTRYVYGTYVGVLNPFAYRNDVLRAEIYPDSDDTVALGNGNDGTYDRIEYLCNRRGNAIQIKHQTGTTHEYVVDKSGRLTHDRITTVGSGVDNAVLRISTTYDIRGLREKLTSYDNATVGSGSVVNEVVFEYDDMGMLVQEYQEHDGAKDANTLYIQYNRDTTVSNGVYTKRLRYTSVRYPDSRLIHSTYGTSGQTDDALNRTAAINADNSGTPGTALAEYTYLGHAQFVKADYPEPDLRFDLDHGTACDYDGIDRFGRVIDLLWRDYGGSADAVRIRHGYDRASNRLWREDSVAAANSAALDELYDYDEVYRLSNLDRGDLNANKDGLSTGTLGFAQQWGLDMTGNWSGFKEDNNGDMTWDLDQSRTYSAANEIAAIDSSSAHVGQDRAGNMTKIPKPGDSNSHYDLTFDAWHRLVKVCDGTNTVAEYEYDAREFQVSKRTYSDGSLNESRHFYYDDMWHCLEERLETGGTISTNADRQFVWGARYYDDLILRDRDTSEPENGTLDERLYFLQDANWNVVGLTDTNGDVQERYIYTAHGAPVILTPAFAGRASTSYDVETLFAGYRYDSVTKTYLVRHRIYHPILGCWVQRDSLRYIDGLNLYQYVGGNPIVGTDPSGQMSPYCVATLYCAISVLAVCNGAMCIGDYWDDPCDTYLDCSFKCWWSIISGKTANSWNGIAWDVICGGAATVCTAQWAKHLWNKWFPPPRQFPSRPMPPRPPGGNGGGGGGGPRPIRPRPPASPAVPTYPQAV